VREFSPGERWGGKEKIQFERDTIINGFSFKAGQWVRHENSDAAVVKRCADRISDKLKQKELTVILYHLNQNNLANYSTHEMENFYNRFR
jgi:hypothetical protein